MKREQKDAVNKQIPKDRLEDGSLLKEAVDLCRRNWCEKSLIILTKVLRGSWVWVPCNAVLSDTDNETVKRMIEEAEENGGLELLEGREIVNHDSIRLVPDILQNGNEYFFPVFTSEEEMGEYGEQFSNIQSHFLEAANLARNNEMNVKGVVINAFTEPFVVPRDMFDLVSRMESVVDTG